MTDSKNINKSFFKEDNISKKILPLFNIYNAEISMVKFKDTDKQRAVYKVIFNNNTYCLKKIYFSKEELLYVYSATQWLYEYGINLPRFIPASNGMRYLNYNNILFILTPWIDGEKCNFDDYNHILKSTTNLAKLHRCSKNFEPICGSYLRKGYNNLYSSIEKHYNELLLLYKNACKKKDNFSKEFIKNIDVNLKLCKYALSYACEINTNLLSKSLCHGDYVNKNIIFSDNNIWVIDFDKCKNDYCAHDLSYFMRRLLKREKTKWNLNLALDILKEYDFHKELNSNDLKYIISYLAFPQKFWKTSHDYYKSSSKSNKDSLYRILLKSSSYINEHLNFIKSLSNELEKANWNISSVKKPSE